MDSETSHHHHPDPDPDCAPVSAVVPPPPSHNDVITAREQRSHIAIIQMAPPAPGSSSSVNKAVSSVPVPPAPPPAGTTSNKVTTLRRGEGGGSESQEKGAPKKKKRHHCSVQGCTYNTAHTKDLARHMRKHTGEKPFKCDRCTKCFTRYDKLVMHIRIHEGHRPFSCPCCDYAAIDSSSLKKHIRTHGNERPYKCERCPYSCKQSSQLVVHMRRHTGDSPYLCTFAGCDAAFKTPSDLTRHLRLHTGEKPFKCLYCNYRAAVKSNLTIHMKRHTKPSNSARTALKNRAGAGARTQCPEPEEDDEFLESDEESHDNQSMNPSNVLPFQYACKFCDHKADTIELFTAHMEEFHKEFKKTGEQRTPKLKIPPSREPPSFQCSSCNVAFISENSLRCHMRQHVTVPNKPANVNPQIYSPTPSPSIHGLHRNYSHANSSIEDYRRNASIENVPNEQTSYRLQELQRAPVPVPVPVVHNTVITENPSVIVNNSNAHATTHTIVSGGNIIQHHHYDEETGHMYVVTYNNLDNVRDPGQDQLY